MCVVCDNTDVFILIIQLYCREQLICNAIKESPIAGCCIIDLKTTANKHNNIADSLPGVGVHALSGCDTLLYTYSTDKIIALKVLTKEKSLKLLGQDHTDLDAVVSEATSFMAICYGSKCDGNVSDVC